MAENKNNNESPVILAWDIETTDLRADWGWILSAAWADLNPANNPDRKISHVRIDQYKGYEKDRTSDRSLCIDLVNALSNADVWVTWYGDKFDIPFVNTRLLAHELGTLPTIPSIDGWRAARNHLKLASNRLASVAELLGVNDKTPVTPAQWQRARAGYRDGINYVVEHNIFDIVTLGEVYDRIRPIIRNHPNLNLVEHPRDQRVHGVNCPTCMSDRVHSRGYRVAKTRRSVRYQCQDCGSWFQGPSRPVQPSGNSSGADGRNDSRGKSTSRKKRVRAPVKN